MNKRTGDRERQTGEKREHAATGGEPGHGISRRAALGALGGIAASAVGLLEVGTPAFARHDEGNRVGSAVRDRAGLGFVGQFEQNDENFTGYGYLTSIRGLDTSSLFADTGQESVETARFTFYATALLVSRNVLGNVFAVDVEGDLSFFFQETGGATFSNPESFRAGTVIARDHLRLQDVLTVIAPNQGLPHLTGELTRTEANKFVFEGRQYRLGHKGLTSRLEATGTGTRTQINPLTTVVQIAGTTTGVE
jgi:hypothetical protein